MLLSESISVHMQQAFTPTSEEGILTAACKAPQLEARVGTNKITRWCK